MAEDRQIKIKIKSDNSSLTDLIKEVKTLREELNKATDPKEVERLNSEFKKTNKQLQDIEATTKEFTLSQTFEEVYGDIQPLSGRLGELEDRMYELALAGKANTTEFKSLQVEASSMRKTITDVDKQVDLLADNKGMSIFSAGISEVGDSLFRLDFESAAMQAGNLSAAASKISFKDAIGSLKNLGKTFMSLGKALLTNPFFLTAAIVGAIVVAIGLLMDEMGILEKVFDAIGDAVGFVIQQLKDLLDWFGATDYAGEDYAANQIENNKKLTKSYTKKMNAVTSGLDHEIAMLQAQGKDTEQLEVNKLIMLQASAEKRLEIAKNTALNIIKVHGKDSEEYKEQVEAIKDLEVEVLNSGRAIELINVKQDQESKERINKNETDKAKVREEAEVKRKEKQIAIAEARLNADRMIQESNIQMIADEMERERQLSVFKEGIAFDDLNREHLTEQQIEDLKVQHLAKLKAIQDSFDTEKESIALAKKEKDTKDEATAEQLLFDQNKRLRQLNLEQSELDRELEIEAKKKSYDEDFELAKGNAELTKKLEQKLSDDITKIKSDANKKQELNDEIFNSAIKQGKLSLTSDITSLVSQAAGEGSTAAKAAAVAQATIDTYLSAQKAFTSQLIPGDPTSPIRGGFAAAAAITSGLLNVKNILSVKTPSGGGGGSISAPPAPTIGTSLDSPSLDFNDNEGAPSGGGGGSNGNQKIMVVDYTDIENKGNEMQKLKERVTLN